MFTQALFTIAKTWKQTKWPSADKWIKRVWYTHHTHTHTHTMEYYPTIKKNEIMPFVATWVELEIKWNKSDKDKYGITYMWNLKKNDTNELIYKTEIDSQT